MEDPYSHAAHAYQPCHFQVRYNLSSCESHLAHYPHHVHDGVYNKSDNNALYAWVGSHIKYCDRRTMMNIHARLTEKDIQLSYPALTTMVCLEDLQLTPRETECVLYCMEGYTSKEVARTLGISFRTVEKHIENVKNKLNCKNMTHLVGLINKKIYERFCR